MRGLNNILKNSLFLGLVVLCASCAPPPGTITARAAANVEQPKRIYIHAALYDTTKVNGGLFGSPHDEADVLAKKLAEAFSSCGIESKFVNLDPLALDNPEVALVKQYDPDSILNIIATRVTRTGNFPVGANYQMTLIEKKTNSPIWKAEADVTKLREVGTILTKLIVSSMQQNGIINSSCRLPAE
jgi:hypothetical protein